MTPAHRLRVIDCMIECLPPNALPDHCTVCDPSGGCATQRLCLGDLCEKLLQVIERESGVTL